MFMMMAGLPSSLDVFVILCRLGGQAPIFQGMFFPNSQVRSGSRGQWLCVSWHSEGCYSGYWWSCALCITSIQLETKWNWDFRDTTRENLRVEWIQVIMTISRSNCFKFKRSTLLSGFPCTRQLSRRQDVRDVSRWDVPQKNRYLTMISNDFSVGRGYQFGGTLTCPDYPPKV